MSVPSATVPPATPALAQWLERQAAEIERNRIDLHVRGAETISSGDAGAIAVTTTYSDYREMGGMRVPLGYVVSNEITGRIIYEVERVEVGVRLPPDSFTFQSSASPGRGQ